MAEVFELAAAVGEPVSARALRGASLSDGVAVFSLRVGEEAVWFRRMAGVDRERGLRARRELGGEARDRVGAVRVDGRVFDARGVGVAGGVEVVGLPAAAKRGVAELAIEAGAGEHEGVVDGQALGDVDGHRVAVLQRRVAVDGPVVEKAGAERDLLAAEVEREPPSLGIDGGDAGRGRR